MCSCTERHTPCIGCTFLRDEYQLAVEELELTRGVLRALCGDRANELIRLLQSRVRVRHVGAPEQVIAEEQRFAAVLATTTASVADSATALVAQLGELTTS